MLVLLLLAAAPAVKPIDAAELRGHVRFLAADLLEGRGPATRGDQLAQQYIASQFETMGLEPGGPDGGWLQPVELVGVDGHPDTLKVQGRSASISLAQSSAPRWLALSMTTVTEYGHCSKKPMPRSKDPRFLSPRRREEAPSTTARARAKASCLGGFG